MYNNLQIPLAYSNKSRIFATLLQKATRLDSLAQLVEHNTFNVGVLGSSPKRITKGNFYSSLFSAPNQRELTITAQ